eukprot:6464349-Amphidinium_carterae.1
MCNFGIATIARIGTRNVVSLVCRLLLSRLRLVCSFTHRLLPASAPVPLPTHEPALAQRQDVDTVWTNGSDSHNSNPQFRRCGVGYVPDTGERLVFRAERLAVARALEEYSPRRVKGHQRPKGKHRDLEERTRLALTPDTQLHWIRARQTQQAALDGRVSMEDFLGNQEAVRSGLVSGCRCLWSSPPLMEVLPRERLMRWVLSTWLSTKILLAAAKGKLKHSCLKHQGSWPLRKHFNQCVDTAVEVESRAPHVEPVVGVG